MSRGDLTEAEWCLLKDLLPPERGRKNRPSSDNRPIVNGILWRIRTGAPWRDVPEKYGNWMTVYHRFRRWSRAGIWEAVATTLTQAMADKLAPQHRLNDRSGAHLGRRRKRGTERQASGRSRGGFTCKVHCLSDAQGIPLVFHLTGAKRPTARRSKT